VIAGTNLELILLEQEQLKPSDADGVTSLVARIVQKLVRHPLSKPGEVIGRS
jgi:hypothetical protein